jgi:hypothetical protein
MSYDRDILDEFEQTRHAPAYPEIEVSLGMVVEDRSSGFCGDVVRWNAEAVTLRDRSQHLRYFTWKPGGFLIEGRPVTLVRPKAVPNATQQISASGAVVTGGPARKKAQIAAASRIWVEGRHDAELLEHVWGAELREYAIVVEPLHGADDLLEAVRAFGPAPDRRLGILLDHLVPGSKESRIATEVTERVPADQVLITGHPFVDVWAGIRPKVMGLEEWPEVPRNIDWKNGLCTALGVPLEGFWPRLRNSVRTFADLRPELVGAVEQLIDFVALPD